MQLLTKSADSVSFARPAVARTRLLPTLLFVTVILLTGLGFSPAARAVDLSGPWSGSWESCQTGHRGPLKGRFEACGDQQYQVTFTGRFFKVFPFRFRVTLDVIEDRGDSITLAGNSYLGRMFGTFTYEANATGTEFSSAYSSKKDHGYFRLSRSCP